MGFNGSFFVCELDSFRTRKDWYLTWRQIKELAEQGFEIGNHTVGHWGGLGHFMVMEDELLANNVPKPTTVCWPVYDVNWNICPALATKGYLFGRGGHFRAYRPAVDNPFDVPSMWCSTVKQFVACVRKATGGKIVVITFHGVPDMEHPSVGIEPEVFKEMMQYLKDNHYRGLALRDLAEYVAPAKAAKLPPTARDFKESGPPKLAQEDKPYGTTISIKPKDKAVPQSEAAASAAKDMLTFVVPTSGSVAISGTRIGVHVPPPTDMTALAPTFTLSPLATAVPPSGTARDFTKPQTYTITAQDGSVQVYTVTVIKSGKPNAFTWSKAVDGTWSDGSKWSNNLASGSAPVAAVTKSGSGTWTLSGANRYTGPTKVIKGTLILTSARGLGDKTEAEISEGAMLGLNSEPRPAALNRCSIPRPTWSAATLT